MTEAQSKNKQKSMADHMLGHAREAKLMVSVYLVNGFQLKGHVIDFDDEAILFSHKNAQQLVMRSGVATMYPLTRSDLDTNGIWRAEVPAE